MMNGQRVRFLGRGVLIGVVKRDAAIAEHVKSIDAGLFGYFVQQRTCRKGTGIKSRIIQHVLKKI